MSFVFGPLGILLVSNVFATSGMQAPSGDRQTPTIQPTLSPMIWKPTTTTVQQQTDTTDYRTINVKTSGTTSSIYDYYLSLFRFRICLKSEEHMNLIFHVKSCHDARIALLTGLYYPMYEIVIGGQNNRSYIQEIRTDGSTTVLDKADGMFVSCNNFDEFSISWKNSSITLETGSKNMRLQVPYIQDASSLLYATVTSGFGATGYWSFKLEDKGMLQQVNFKYKKERVCPLVAECGFVKEIPSSCNPIIFESKLDCRNLKVGIYTRFNCSTDNACTTEFIKLIGCTSTTQDCKTCNIIDFTFHAALLCRAKHPKKYFKVMDVKTCHTDYTIYFRYLHFKSTSHDTTTTTAVSSATTTTDKSTMAPTTTPTSRAPTTTPTSMAPTTTPTPRAPTTTPTSTVFTSTPTSRNPATTTVKSTSMNPFAESQQKSNTPLTIGITVGATGLLLAVICAVVLLIFIRRSRKAERKQSSTIIVSKSDDYTGNQSIALPSGVHIPNSDKYTDIQLEIEDQHYQELTTISKSENDVSYDYIDTSDVKRKSVPKTDKGCQKPEYVKQVRDVPDYTTKTDGNNYSVLDPDETGFNRSRELPKIVTETDAGSAYAVLDPTVTGFDRSVIPPVQPVETYAILDPRETGFNRLEKANQSAYEMAKPLTDEKMGEISEQPYRSDYNELGDSVLKKVEENVYSHSVDNVYDSASHNSKSKESDGTYDHFVGQ